MLIKMSAVIFFRFFFSFNSIKAHRGKTFHVVESIFTAFSLTLLKLKIKNKIKASILSLLVRVTMKLFVLKQ